MSLQQQGHRPLLPAYLETWATDTPGRIAMVEVESGVQWLYGHLAARMYVWVRFLQARKIESGDRILIAMPPGPNLMALMWACWRLGAVPSLVPVSLTANALIRMWGLIEPRLALVSDQVAETIEQAGVNFRKEKTLTYLVGRNGGFRGIKQVPTALSRLKPTHLRQTDYRKWRALSQALPELHAWHPALILPAHEHLHTPFVMCFEHIEAQLGFLAGQCSFGDRIKSLVQPSGTQWHDWLMGWILPLASGGNVVIGPSVARRQQLYSLIEIYQINTLVSRELDLVVGSQSQKASLRSLEQVFVPQQGVNLFVHGDLKAHATIGPCLPETGGFFARQVINRDQTPSYLPFGPISIREPMAPQGRDGLALPENIIGEVCVHPPFVFAGYLDPSFSLGSRISQSGLYYTGLKGKILGKGEAQKLVFLPEKSTIPPQHASPSPDASRV